MKSNSLLLLCALVLSGFFFACGSGEKTTEAESTKATSKKSGSFVAEEGFTVLFDGTSLDGWRNFKADTLSPVWKIEDDGSFTLSAKGGGDIVTDKIYESFDLRLDWKISKDGNSGIMFHVAEHDSLRAPYLTGPEMQILHNEGHPDGKIHMHRAGDNYDLHASSVETVKGPGEWNSVRLVVNQGNVEQWLNGTKVVEYTLGSEDWEERLAKSKFAKWPVYGRAGKGVIALQDHGDAVWFRNIRIKEL
ncbi:MAG: DUF1080 domain-containing protein [Bacteroidia bacterium]